MSTVLRSMIDASDKEKYSNPIPNRDAIIKLIANRNKKTTRGHLAKALNLYDDQQKEGLRRRLNAMIRDEQIYYDHSYGYGVYSQQNLIKGQVKGHSKGFGFLTCDKTQENLFLSKRQMLKTFDGDMVAVVAGELDRQGRREGFIVNVIEHNTKALVGCLMAKGHEYFLLPENSRISNEIRIAKDQCMDAKEGQYVVVKITQYPNHRNTACGQVIEILGDSMAPGMETDVAIRNHSIPYLWPKKVLQSANRMGAKVSQADKLGRTDLTNTPFVTIDGEDARDFDDAVYCRKKPLGGWQLSVAIADVSHYVLPDTPLDKEAQKRGTSVYFPQRVVPMLPETLSNGLCSLNPNVERLAMVCEMSINRCGKMTSCHFSQAVIRSHARLTYDEVATMLTDAEAGNAAQTDATTQANINELHQLYGVLRKARTVRGAVDFETPETRYQFNEQSKIGQILPQQRTDAHRIIEECMLCANVAAAQFLQKHRLPALYRIHQGPQLKKLTELRAFLAEKGLSLAGGSAPKPRHYDRLLGNISTRPDAKAIELMLLKSLGQAQYDSDNQGHFGLACPAYAHFTSPIRRYPDLLVHRAIRAQLNRQNQPNRLKRFIQSFSSITNNSVATAETPAYQIKAEASQIESQNLQNMAEHCSAVSRRADKASSDVENWLECEYMSDSVGKAFVGSISGVSNFGVFIALADTQIECLVHKSTLDKTRYALDVVKHMITDKKKSTHFSLGDSVRIRIKQINMAQRKIECEWLCGC